MKCYFESLDALHCFSLSLDCQTDPIRCQHCSQCDQFVSHGFVYKKQHRGDPLAVGKRLLCSNRYGHSGCGRTVRLYLQTQIARLHYTAVQLSVFLLALLAGRSIQQAYQSATQTSEPRNAWRWLNKLQRKLIDYRALIHRRMSAGRDTTPNKQHGILLSTLQLLFSLFGNSACARFQQQTQNTFL